MLTILLVESPRLSGSVAALCGNGDGVLDILEFGSGSLTLGLRCVSLVWMLESALGLGSRTVCLRCRLWTLVSRPLANGFLSSPGLYEELNLSDCINRNRSLSVAFSTRRSFGVLGRGLSRGSIARPRPIGKSEFEASPFPG